MVPCPCSGTRVEKAKETKQGSEGGGQTATRDQKVGVRLEPLAVIEKMEATGAAENGKVWRR